jgi:hypothetical protein
VAEAAGEFRLQRREWADKKIQHRGFSLPYPEGPRVPAMAALTRGGQTNIRRTSPPKLVLPIHGSIGRALATYLR